MPPSKHQKQGGGWLGMGRRRAEDEHALPAPEAAPDPIRDPDVDDTDVPPPTAQPAPPLGDPETSEGTEGTEGTDGAGDPAREPADDDEPVESFEEQERAEEQAEARRLAMGEPGEELADDTAAIPLPADAEPTAEPPTELDSPLASEAVQPDERIAEPMPNDPAPTPPLAEPDTATSKDPFSPEASAPDLEPAIDEAVPAVRQPTTDDLEKLVGGASTDPHALLGAHPSGDEVVVRALRPDAVAVTVLSGDERVRATQVHHAGVWEALLPGGQVRDYRVEVEYGSGTYTQDDPYRYLPTLGEVDQHLIREGRHERLWEVLGSHVRDYAGADAPVRGTSFAVWAPNALGVRVAGDFNFWDGRANPMRLLGSSGVWELFVPDVGDGALYKYQVLGADGQWREKADPMARRTQVPPDTASVVTVSRHDWSDATWVEQRSRTAWHAAPMSIYEIHLGSWRQGLDYRALADELIPYLQETGFTHVEMLPTAEHPFGGSWGYQVSAYYAPSARFGTPDDFRYLVDRLHEAGIGVLVDWVPAHFPKDAWALGRFDGTPLYEHPDPHRGEQLDWGTYVFDFGRHEVRNFLVANALFWLEEFHIDGLRVDAVASMLYLDYSRPEGGWTPNIHGGRENLEAVQFLQEANATVYKHFPGVVMIAEESTSWPGVTRSTHLGGLGFGFKWNMGWMHDTLDYLARPPVYRSYHHHQMTFSMMYAYSENFVLPISHDEVVHGKGSLLRKMPGDRWQQLANLRALLAFMWAHPGKQLLFMGSEFGQESEWSEGRSLDWWLLDNPDHRGVQHLVRDLNSTYRDTAALWSRDTDPAGFAWIDANDAGNNTFSFLRVGDDGSELACVVNFSGTPIPGYRLGLPHAGRWDEVLNTDAEVYAGSGVGNYGGVDAEQVEHHGQPASAELTLPPLGALWLRSAR